MRPQWQDVLQAQGPNLESQTKRASLLPLAREIEVIARSKDGAFEQRTTLPVSMNDSQKFTHVTTDRVLYRPGEILRARVTALDRRSLRPIQGNGRIASIELVDPKGARAMRGFVIADGGFAGMAWTLPETAAGGRYALELRTFHGRQGSGGKQRGGSTQRRGWLLARHEFTVLRHTPQRLQKHLDLDAESYALGEQGSAELEVRRQGRSGAEAIAAGAKVDAQVILDGKPVWTGDATLDDQGHATVVFELPQPDAFELRAGDGRFVARITDGGTTETVIEPFVVPIDRLDVSFFPEGGELVAGFAGRVYAEVADAHGQPIDARGAIRDADDRLVAEFATSHQGRARFELWPRGGERYTLFLAEPFAQRIDLPPVKTDAVGLRARTDSIAAGEPLAATIHTPSNGPWLATAFVRGQPVAQKAFTGAGRQDLLLELPDTAVGVLRLTVFDSQLKPVAERLMQRQSKRQLRIELTAKHESLAPGQRQSIDVRTFDETGEPVAAVVGLTVADRASRDQLDERRRIGVVDQLLLCGDVERLEDVHEFFVDGKDGAHRVDLLLGTLGWRRFAWADPARIAELKDTDTLRAELLIAQEGRAQRPQIADVAPSLLASRRARDRAWDNLGKAGLISLIVAYTLLALAALRRRPAPMVRPLAIGIPLLALLPMIAAPRILGGADSAPATMSFAADLADSEAKLASSISSVADTVVTDPLELVFEDSTVDLGERAGWSVGVTPEPRTSFGFDDFGRRNVINPSAPGEIGTELSAGAFFNDGGDGDVRARTENFFEEPIAEVEEVEEVALEEMLSARVDPAAESAFDSSAWNSAIGLGGQAGYYRFTRANRRPSPYAHTYHNAANDGVRRDFTETVFWKADVRTSLGSNTNPTTTIEFDVSDRLTTWVVSADGHQVGGTGNGRIGQAEITFTTRKPVELDVVLPVEVSAGDLLVLPVAVRVDGYDAPHADLVVKASGAVQRAPGTPLRKVDLVAHPRSGPTQPQTGRQPKAGRSTIAFRITDAEAKSSTVQIAAKVGRHMDAARHELRVTPRGFPRRQDQSGVAKTTATIPLDLPADARNMDARLTLYPSPLASLRQGLQGMLREPHGCFEQTSSTNYPNVLVVSLLGLLQSDAPKLMREAKAKLASGYQRLTGYECPNGGFDWWGKDPGHAALTAYGLLQFFDMSKVYPVDQQLIVRTQQWLLAKRDGTGGFKRSADGHTFGNAPQPIVDAYLCYALVATGVSATELQRELDAIEAHALAASNRDSYELALVACALRDAGRQVPAARLRQRLAKLQQPSSDGAKARATRGSLIGSTSITRSGGHDLRVETTALAMLAWLGQVTDDEPSYENNVQSALMWLQRNRRGSGTFGGTQATVLALRALSEATLRHRSPVQAARIVLSVDGKVVANRQLAAGSHRAIAFEHLERHLLDAGRSGGRRELKLEVGDNRIPYSLELGYHTDRPNDSARAPLRLQTDIAAKPIEEGRSVAVEIRLGNQTDEAVHNPIAIIGLPAGLEVPPNVLDALRDAGRFAAWELNGRELVLYWRGIRPRHTLNVVVDAIAKIPGTTTGPASRAYPYYDGEAKRWAEPLRVVIEPK